MRVRSLPVRTSSLPPPAPYATLRHRSRPVPAITPPLNVQESPFWEGYYSEAGHANRPGGVVGAAINIIHEMCHWGEFSGVWGLKKFNEVYGPVKCRNLILNNQFEYARENIDNYAFWIASRYLFFLDCYAWDPYAPHSMGCTGGSGGVTCCVECLTPIFDQEETWGCTQEDY